MILSAVLAAAACLVAAVALQGWRQLAVGVLAAGAAVVSGAVDPPRAWDAVTGLLPVVGYLVAILLLATLAQRAGVFAWLGAAVARGARGSTSRLLGLGVAAAAVVTVLLTLDATVVLLVPVLVLAARALAADPWPLDLASVRLANSASILLPVSNLTNLVAFTASGLTFATFTLLMAPAWLLAVAVEYAVVRAAARRRPAAAPSAGPEPDLPQPAPDRLTLVVLAAALVAIVVAGELHVEPVWPALVAALVLAARAVTTRRTDLHLAPRAVLAAAHLPFAVFVLCWSVAVAALAERGGADLLARLLPDGTSAPALVGIALVATLAANVVNNLPATLLLVPLVAPLGSVAVLAALIGVGVGAGATYAGSLANLLWLRNPGVAHPADVGRRFHVVGLAVSPLLVVAATLVLAATAHLAAGAGLAVP
ncbi:ArsB/NhaD family transporter [Nocardioides zeae]|uniref:ArsB/NhaD family transporter n=1 Tax=Nocardioides imazamoxiresistens TaxID=3231893 RepID=A0ABU3PV08_9ACTN|nr:SLC13 family permease [Nocardioides zeae]MDT9593063.1 ArsB/NhaD family transporter [Nocardioides zeae]